MLFKNISDIYAKSIFRVAVQEKKIDRWQKILNVFSVISQNKDIKIIFSGYFDYLKSYNFLKFLLYKFQVRNSEKNFFKLLFKNKKFFLLPEIYKVYKFKKNQYKNIMKVSLQSSHFIDHVQKKKIIDFLANFFSKKISLKYIINKNLINGIKIIIDGFVIDYSIKHDLKYLTSFLKI